MNRQRIETTAVILAGVALDVPAAWFLGNYSDVVQAPGLRQFIERAGNLGMMLFIPLGLVSFAISAAYWAWKARSIGRGSGIALALCCFVALAGVIAVGSEWRKLGG